MITVHINNIMSTKMTSASKALSWLYICGFLFIIFCGVTAAIYFGTKPKSIPKISLSHFVTPEEFGQNIYKRLRQEVNENHLIFLGIQENQNTNDQILVWKGFLDSIDPEFKFTTLIVDSSVTKNDILQANETISLQENPENYIEGFKQILAEKKRVAVLGPTSFFSYMIKNNFQNLLRSRVYDQKNGKVFSVDWLTFSLSSFANSAEEINSIPFPCNSSPHDLDGASELGCMILLKSKVNFRKKRVPGKYPGMLDQIGSKEYLALFAKKIPN